MYSGVCLRKYERDFNKKGKRKAVSNIEKNITEQVEE